MLPGERNQFDGVSLYGEREYREQGESSEPASHIENLSEQGLISATTLKASHIAFGWS